MNSAARAFIEQVVQEEQEAISSPVYEFGSYRCYGSPIEELRPLFPGLKYVGGDIREGPGVDEILNVMAVALENESAGVVICAETLEHVLHPWTAITEMFRILKPGGLFILTSVFVCPIHDHPCDYWRFTPEIFKEFLKPFSRSAVSFDGEEINPIHIMGYGVK